METIEKREKVHELIKEQQQEKKEQAIFDIDTIRMNASNLIKWSQVQLASTLKELAASEDEIIHEMNEYWMKELPIHKPVLVYIKATANLINIYTQQEELYKKTLEEIYSAVDFPEWNKVEATYLETIDSLKQQLEMMRKEFMKLKKDLTEDMEQQKEQWEIAKNKEFEKLSVAQKNEIAKVHMQYSTTFHEAEQENIRMKAENAKLKEQIESMVAEWNKLEEEVDALRAAQNKKISSPEGVIPQNENTKVEVSPANHAMRPSPSPIIASAPREAEKVESEIDEKRKFMMEKNPDDIYESMKASSQPSKFQLIDTAGQEKEIRKQYLKYVSEELPRLAIRKRLLKLYSSKTISKHLDKMLDLGWLELLPNEFLLIHSEKIPPDYFSKKEWEYIFKKGEPKDEKA